MTISTPSPSKRGKSKKSWIIISLILILSLGCNLPFGIQKGLPTAEETAAGLPEKIRDIDIPPAIVETDPIPNSTLGDGNGVVLIFDQSMEPASVEGAIHLEPALSVQFDWLDDTRLQLTPDTALLPEQTLTVNVDENARSINGQNLLHAAVFQYYAPGTLRIAEKIPAPGINTVDPSSYVAVTFTQPVVALGDDSDLPAAFSLAPGVTGEGKWLNTSTYLFKPETALLGGTTYTVSIDPNLSSLGGTGFTDQENLEWQFSTVLPELLDIEPDAGLTVWLDTGFTLQFNQAMDRTSVEKGLSLMADSGAKANGSYIWSENDTRVTFQPDALLNRGAKYLLSLQGSVQSLGGAALDKNHSYQYQAAGNLEIWSTEPGQGSILNSYGGYATIVLRFTAPLDETQKLEDLIKVEPEVNNLYINLTDDKTAIYISGIFSEGQKYYISISSQLSDRWGQKLGNNIQKSIVIADADPRLSIPMGYWGSSAVFISSGETVLPATAVNISQVSINSTQMDLENFISGVGSTCNFEGSSQVFNWTFDVDSPLNTSRAINIPLTQEGSPLESGLYCYQIDSSPQAPYYEPMTLYVVASPSQLTVKMSEEEAFVWAVNLDFNSPIVGRPVTIYGESGKVWGHGETDAEGIVRIKLSSDRNRDEQWVGVLGSPDDEDFTVVFKDWNFGISPWEFSMPSSRKMPENKAYFYTDRPIYQPGQTVFLRGIVKTLDGARYRPANLEEIPLRITSPYQAESGTNPILDELTLPVSAYGTFSANVTLPEDAQPGIYTVQIPETDWGYVNFQVASYRKPEIDLLVETSKEELLPGEDFNAMINADYFFGSPAAGLEVHWSLYSQQEYLIIPGGYQFGEIDSSWMDPYWMWSMANPLGDYLTSGTGFTKQNGEFAINIDSGELDQLVNSHALEHLTLEVSIVDSNNQTISERATLRLHPSKIYTGVRPESWSGVAESPIGFSILTVDTAGVPVGNQMLSAVMQEVRFVQDMESTDTYGGSYHKELTEVASSDLKTDSEGHARLEFTPPAAGLYQVEVSGEGSLTQVYLWVGGTSAISWPQLPYQHLKIETDQSAYKPGDTAKLFIPNPFAGPALALVTVERESVLRSEVQTLSEASQVIELTLGEEDSPNVYISVMVVGQEGLSSAGFRMGYANIHVNPAFLSLNVTLTPDKETIEPGESVQVDMLVTDQQGKPVQGEFSLAAVDKAIYALAEPFEEPIVEAFYGTQPLQVYTSASLTANVSVKSIEPPGRGGGGGDYLLTPSLRENFQDTAYWQAKVETGSDGRASVTFPLPDNLTTWIVQVRGLTRDMLVGEASTELVVTKPLLIRPVTPQFFVAGDRVQLGAVIHNLTERDLEVVVDLQASGISLEELQGRQQTIRVEANKWERVNWWATVDSADFVSLVFSVKGGGLQDAARPDGGDIPILNYASPATLATSGVLINETESLEVVSLPRSYKPIGGSLQVEMTSSLAGTMLGGLEAFEAYPYDFNEPVISRVFANLAVQAVIKSGARQYPDLESKLQTAIRDGLDRMEILQNEDGGWGWIKGSDSLVDISASGLLVFNQAVEAGFIVDAKALENANRFLESRLFVPRMSHDQHQLDNITLTVFALGPLKARTTVLDGLFSVREKLSPWSQALAAMLFAEREDERAADLISNLKSSAIRSASGVNWQQESIQWYPQNSPLATTGAVVSALAKGDPASPLLADAVRYLIDHRRGTGGWNSSYETAWILNGLERVIAATGEVNAKTTFTVTLNDVHLASGGGSTHQGVQVVRSETPLEELSAERGNLLHFSREGGPGRLYYRALLELYQPVSGVGAVDKGVTISREVVSGEQKCTHQDCPVVSFISLSQDLPLLTVKISVTVPKDLYYLVVEDTIPAGVEIVNQDLKSTQLGPGAAPSQDTIATDINLSTQGWGWWYFSSPRITRNQVRWIAEFVPAGTYMLTYQVQTQFAGTFHAIPARAYSYYFPDVEGRSAGSLLTITE